MPPRRKKSKSRRRRFTGLNVLKAAEAYALTNVWTEAAFNANPIEFLTGFAHPRTGAYAPGTDGGEIITLPELLGAGPGGFGGNYGAYATGFTDAVSKNIAGNGTVLEGLAQTALKSAGISIGFRLASRVTRSPRAMFNKLLRMLGVGDMLSV